MPMFIDRHDAPGITPEQLAEAHTADLAVQEQYGVHYHTYWFDPADGTVFCLAEGPDEHAVQEVHRVAHGAMASAIIEVDLNAPLNALFGPMPTYPAGTPYTAPGMRAIVFTDICGSVAQTHALGDEGHMAVLREHDTIVRSALAGHDGREVKHTGDGIMASFTSISAAVGFAVEVQRAVAARNESASTPLHVSIGISAGEPVTGDDDDLFGAAVQMAARVCNAADAGDIHVTVVVRELCLGKSFRFEDRGDVAFKGLPEPARIYAVTWQDAG
jgi:class 3 adenylate cyclase